MLSGVWGRLTSKETNLVDTVGMSKRFWDSLKSSQIFLAKIMLDNSMKAGIQGTTVFKFQKQFIGKFIDILVRHIFGTLQGLYVLCPISGRRIFDIEV